MNTQEMAQHIYREWAHQMDLLEPFPETVLMHVDGERKEVPTGRTRPRPRWDTLTSQTQSMWHKVAEVALRIGTVV